MEHSSVHGVGFEGAKVTRRFGLNQKT